MFLSQKAGAIRALAKSIVSDVIEIGRHLTEAKERCAHGQWLPWLEDEFGWSDQTARRFTHVYELWLKNNNLLNLPIDVSSLYLLAAPKTPAEVRHEAMRRAENGEGLTRADIAVMMADFKAKTDSESAAELKRQIALKTAELEKQNEGKLVVDPQDLAEQIAKAVAPLKRRLEQFEEADRRRIENERMQAEAARQKREAEPGPPVEPIDRDLSLRSTGIQSALRDFAANLKMSPKELIETERKLGKITKQSLDGRIGEAVADARHAVTWLNDFLALVDREAENDGAQKVELGD
jgi:hypothetical protein